MEKLKEKLAALREEADSLTERAEALEKELLERDGEDSSLHEFHRLLEQDPRIVSRKKRIAELVDQMGACRRKTQDL
ncbi:hypothetical protein ACWC4A_53645 [Streptomyces mirabilis]